MMMATARLRTRQSCDACKNRKTKCVQTGEPSAEAKPLKVGKLTEADPTVPIIRPRAMPLLRIHGRDVLDQRPPAAAALLPRV